jgi:hypothetical protein
MNNDDDYSLVDEVVHYVTIFVLFLMTIVFLGMLAGLLWAMI